MAIHFFASTAGLKNLYATLLYMCGIFAYTGHEPLLIVEVLKILHILEKEQEPVEKSPVGGHGTGIAFLNKRSEFTLEKVGKTNGSPVDDLMLLLGETARGSRLILGHVRHASPEFEKTIQYKECTQPYKVACQSDFTVVSAHNGYLENYVEARKKLKPSHCFESESYSLIDSEVIPHIFEELLLQNQDAENACNQLFKLMDGNNAVVILSLRKSEGSLHIIHKGTSRGLNIWTNRQREIIICSREKPVQNVLGNVLTQDGFQKIVSVRLKEPSNLSQTFKLTLP